MKTSSLEIRFLIILCLLVAKSSKNDKMTNNCKGNILLKYKFQLNMFICKRVVKLEAKNPLPRPPRKKKFLSDKKLQAMLLKVI